MASARVVELVFGLFIADLKFLRLVLLLVLFDTGWGRLAQQHALLGAQKSPSPWDKKSIEHRQSYGMPHGYGTGYGKGW